MTRLPSLELPRSVSSPLVGQSHRPQRPATADVPPPLVTSSALQLLSSASEMQDGFGEDSVRMSLSEWLQSFELEERGYASAAVYTELKLRQALVVTSQLPLPNAFRTAAVCACFDRLASQLPRYDGMLGILRHEMLRSIYVNYSHETLAQSSGHSPAKASGGREQPVPIPAVSASGYSTGKTYFDELARERRRSDEFEALIALWERERDEAVKAIEARSSAADAFIEKLRVLIAQWTPERMGRKSAQQGGPARRRAMVQAKSALGTKRGSADRSASKLDASGTIAEGDEDEEDEDEGEGDEPEVAQAPAEAAVLGVSARRRDSLFAGADGTMRRRDSSPFIGPNGAPRRKSVLVAAPQNSAVRGRGAVSVADRAERDRIAAEVDERLAETLGELESALEALQVEQEVATLDPVSKIWRLFDDLSVYQQHKVRMRRSRWWWRWCRVVTAAVVDA